MVSGEFKEGTLLAPYKVYYDDGSVYLEKNSKGEYKKYDRNKLLVLEIVPTQCKTKTTYSRASNSKGIQTPNYACFIKKSTNRCKLVLFDTETNARLMVSFVMNFIFREQFF